MTTTRPEVAIGSVTTVGPEQRKRGAGKPFEPGRSGNPGGRPKAIQEVIDLARSHTSMAISVLAEIATNPRAAAVARVSAANSLLERGWGKPVQPIDLTVQSDIPAVIAAGHKRVRDSVRLNEFPPSTLDSIAIGRRVAE